MPSGEARRMIAAILSALLSLSLVSNWIKRHALDVEEGSEIPMRWIAWGKCIPITRNPAHTFSYFVMRLPSYTWERVWWMRDRYEWRQRAVSYFNGKWQLITAPCKG
jgi:hypothetical protein